MAAGEKETARKNVIHALKERGVRASVRWGLGVGWLRHLGLLWQFGLWVGGACGRASRGGGLWQQDGGSRILGECGQAVQAVQAALLHCASFRSVSTGSTAITCTRMWSKSLSRRKRRYVIL